MSPGGTILLQIAATPREIGVLLRLLFLLYFVAGFFQGVERSEWDGLNRAWNLGMEPTYSGDPFGGKGGIGYCFFTPYVILL